MLPPRPERTWWELSASVLGHALIFVLVVSLLNSPSDDPEEPQAQRTDQPATQQMPIFVPPPKQPTPQSPQQQSAPTPPRVVMPSTPQAAPTQAPPASQSPREERPNAPPEEQRKDGAREPDDAGDKPKEPTRAEQKPTTPRPATTPRVPLASAEAAATQEAEARRLFGQKRSEFATDDPITVRPFAVGPDGKPQKCDPLPRMTKDANGKGPIGVAVGRILRDNGSPLDGALLQMVGTQYVTFTDAAGEYRFTYDMTLIEDCRTQYVRVSAKGYESRLLVLVIGERTRSEDVELRRNSGFPIGLRGGS